MTFKVETKPEFCDGKLFIIAIYYKHFSPAKVEIAIPSTVHFSGLVIS
jgi:hypothetical protein